MSTRPKILIDNILPAGTIREIISHIPDGVYQRNGQLVRIIKVKESNEDNKKNNKHPDTLIIRPYTNSILSLALLSNIDFFRMKKTKDGIEEKRTTIDQNILTTMIELGSYGDMSVLNGISETPFMRIDGSICDTVGYDRLSGVYYNPSFEFPKVPDNPTWDDVLKSYNNLMYVFSDFPFVKHYHKVVPLALMLSITLRQLVGNVPLFVVEASTPGSGKTLLVDACSMILFGRVTPKNSWPSGNNKNEELEKILSAIALDGSQFVNFDNASRKSRIEGSALDKVLTCNGAVKMRVLGKSLVPEMKWHTVLTLTGNNAIANVKGDTVRRVCPCRIEPDCENPEDRYNDVKEKDLLGYVEKKRASLVIDLLTLARFWHNNKRPTCNDKRVGSFESWCDVIGGIIMSCSGIDIVECMKSMQSNGDDDYDTTLSIIEKLYSDYSSGFLSSDIVSKCDSDSSYSRLFTVMIPGRDRINSRTVGHFLNKINGRIMGGYKLVKMGSDHRSIRWNVVKSQ
jgi:hypothetical protein